jgi:hypothetical protein
MTPVQIAEAQKLAREMEAGPKMSYHDDKA